MKYKDVLEKAKTENINITKLFIAYEVECLLKDHEICDDEFENICSQIYEYYLLIDYSSINDVSKIVYDFYLNKKSINEKIVRLKLEEMYL